MIAPLISIIVPIYNSEKTIKMCIESLLNQTYSNFEVILVDDGSVDCTAKICHKLSKKDKRLVYYHKENGGLSDARNYGFKHVSGDYIMFLDSDDIFSECCLESMIKIIREADVDIISFNFSYDLKSLEKNNDLEYDPNCIVTKDIMHQYFMKEVAVTNRCFKRTILNGISFVKGQVSEDVIYLFKCYTKAKKIYIASQAYYFYNQNGVSITRSGLSINDNSSVDANVEVLNSCYRFFSSYIHLAKLQYYKSIFNIVNKLAIRDYKDQKAKEFYFYKIPNYIKELRKNYFSIILSKSFSKNDKIQISILFLSKHLFMSIKKLISRRSNFEKKVG